MKLSNWIRVEAVFVWNAVASKLINYYVILSHVI